MTWKYILISIICFILIVLYFYLKKIAWVCPSTGSLKYYNTGVNIKGYGYIFCQILWLCRNMSDFKKTGSGKIACFQDAFPVNLLSHTILPLAPWSKPQGCQCLIPAPFGKIPLRPQSLLLAVSMQIIFAVEFRKAGLCTHKVSHINATDFVSQLV